MLELFIVAVYSMLLTLLFIYGLNIFYLTYLAIRYRDAEPATPTIDDYPAVTVQLPVYNERYVAQRVIEAACKLDWPSGKLSIQVLDDSTDDTTTIVARTVAHFQAQGINIEHIHREHRQGFKAGALADGLAIAEGDFIAIFDADFAPSSDFLKQTVPHFANPRIAFVQTRWGHLNADYSLLTQMESIAIDAHFAVEQYARNRAAFLMNFNGTGGVWRRTAIDEAGGWQPDTLTEDLDLSYRAQLAGWQGLYLRDVVAPGEIPVTLNSFRRQQHRWARGSTECAKKLLPQVWRSSLSRSVKFQATMHVTGYAIQLLMSMVVLFYLPLLLLVPPRPELNPLYAITVVFTLTFFAPTIYLITGQRELGKQWRDQWRQVIWLSFLGVGMMYHNAVAVMMGLVSRKPAVFDRTPKYGIVDRQQQWSQRTSYRLKLEITVFLEVFMWFYNIATIVLALLQRNYSIAFYATFFWLGLTYVLLLNAQQEWQRMVDSRRLSFTGDEPSPVHPLQHLLPDGE